MKARSLGKILGRELSYLLLLHLLVKFFLDAAQDIKANLRECAVFVRYQLFGDPQPFAFGIDQIRVEGIIVFDRSTEDEHCFNKGPEHDVG